MKQSGGQAMKRTIIGCILFILLVPHLVRAGVEGRFMSMPDIRGEQIVFTYENDLWRVSRTGGLAVRLTSHPGGETAAKISPSGEWVAFTGNYHRGAHVYKMSISGGTPERLTYRSGARVVTWTPDGRKIVFRSGMENTFRPIVKLFAVPADGGWPEKLGVPRGVLCSFSPDGKKMAYNRRGREEYYWKRYKGGQYQDIWIRDFENDTFSPVTEYVGKNSYPMWIGEKIYFVSDRGENGIANIYAYDLTNETVRQITEYDDFDVQMPSTDGRRIVYMHSGYLYVLDTSDEKAVRVSVEIPTDSWQLQSRTLNPGEYIHSMSITNDGKTAVFEARGDVYLISSEKPEETVNKTRSCATRERYPSLSPDGKWLAFFSDKTGEYELYIVPASGDGEWIQLTDGLKTTVYHCEWSPDSRKVLFGDKSFAIFYVDISDKKLIKVDQSNQLKNDEFYWEISDYVWSPDSRWIAYSLVQYNRNSKIFLYNLETAKIHPVTGDFYDNLNPGFDAGGEYLYFLSYRNFGVQMDVFEDNHVIPDPVQVMAVQLKGGQKPPFDKSGDRKKGGEKQPFRIDIQGIQDRIYPLPVKAGNYFYLKAGNGYVTWASRDAFTDNDYDAIFTPRGRDIYELHVFDMETEKEAVLKEKISDWRISQNGEYALIKKRDKYSADTMKKIHASASPGRSLNLKYMSYRVEPRKEWEQIFNDTWRWYRDFFYAPNMHGRDWKKMGETYRAYIPQLTSRQDLNWLLSQMVGELCVSHTYVWGGDMGPGQRVDDPVYTGWLGAELKPSKSGYYRLATVFGPTPYDRSLKGPLARPDIDVREGDYLIAINGHEIKYPENPYRYLQITSGEKVRISVNRKPAASGAKTCEIEPIRSEYVLRYNRWLADNIKKVLDASGGKIGYMHITAMSSRNVAQFDKFWRAFRYKDGLIIDVRGNGGGWTEYFIIDKLERKMVAQNVLKEMVPFRYPGSVHSGHLAVLTNEYNGSDGEAFVQHFKARKLGTVIGVPSWGGLVGIINGQTTIDNGTVHQSNNSFYGQERQWWVENHGADPDMLVENDPASAMAGEDKQLETAVRVLMKQIQEKPHSFPTLPDYPRK
jgi:tricorn protease